MPVEEHAYLSASSSHRWLICPPILQVEARFENKDTEFTREGTAAHLLAEIKLRQFLGENVVEDIKAFTENSTYYNKEMDEMTDLYVNLVEEQFNAHKNAEMQLEVKVDYSPWAPGGFGTSDVVILSDGLIEIIDLKYGKGVPVEAYLNPQLMLYALGAYNIYDIAYDFDKIRMTIVQPRLDNVSSFDIEVNELLYWANNYVAPRAVLADLGIGEWTITDDVVKFSKVRAQLRPRAEKNFEVIDGYIDEEPALLDANEISEILERSSEITKWIEHVNAYALTEALQGKKFPGFKLVEGRSNRKITNENLLAERLVKEGFSEDEIYKPKTLESLTVLEKRVGKKCFNELASSLIVKPEGKPTLVPMSDKRPELNSLEQARSEFDIYEE